MGHFLFCNVRFDFGLILTVFPSIPTYKYNAIYYFLDQPFYWAAIERRRKHAHAYISDTLFRIQVRWGGNLRWFSIIIIILKWINIVLRWMCLVFDLVVGKQICIIMDSSICEFLFVAFNKRFTQVYPGYANKIHFQLCARLNDELQQYEWIRSYKPKKPNSECVCVCAFLERCSVVVIL